MKAIQIIITTNKCFVEDPELDKLIEKFKFQLHPITNEPFKREIIEFHRYNIPTFPFSKEETNYHNLLDKSNLILLTGGTGTGKTLLIPYFTLSYFIKKGSSKKVMYGSKKAQI